MLFLACISDEFGLFSSLIISFTYSFFYFYSLNFNIKKIFIASFGLCLIIFTSINGINAILFNLGSGFSSFFISFGGESIRFGTIQRFDSVFLYLLNIIFGSIFYFNKSGLIITKFIFIVIFLLLLIKYTYIYVKIFINDKKNILINFIKFLKINLLFLNWLFILIFINLFVLPGGGDDFGHRGYAKSMLVSIFLYICIMKIFKLDINKIKVFLIFILFHSVFFIFNNHSNNVFTNRIFNFFINDNSVNWTDLKKIKESVIEYHQFNNSKTFDSINNNQEIDFSGTWYYSRISNYDTTKKSYFPVKGTVDVLIWPKKTQ
jgi:hypothetical protein